MFESVIKDFKLCAPIIFLQSTLNELHIPTLSNNSILTHKTRLFQLNEPSNETLKHNKTSSFFSV